MVKKKKIALLKRSTIKKPKYKSDVEPGFISHQFWKDWEDSGSQRRPSPQGFR